MSFLLKTPAFFVAISIRRIDILQSLDPLGNSSVLEALAVWVGWW